ncbi:MAG: alpha/beta hydrolase [Pseudomonadota bacterium]
MFELFDDPTVLGGVAAGLIALVLVVFFATRRLPPVGRWLARSLVLVAIAVPAVLAIVMPELNTARTARSAKPTGSSAPTSVGAPTIKRPTTPRPPVVQREPVKPRAPSAPIGPTVTERADRSAGGRTRSVGGARETEAEGGEAQPGNASASSDKWDVVPVFYGTDRLRGKETPRRISYGFERANRLELGHALVTIPKAHQVPEIERPWVYRLPFTRVVIYEEKEDPAKHFTLRTVRSLPRDAFLELVRDRLKQSARFKDHALIFVHGFNTTFDFGLYRAAQLSYDMKFDGAPFVYSFPSKGSWDDYTYDRESAGQAEPYFEEFVKLVLQQTGAKAVSIVAHSMGNQLLLPVLRNLRQQLPANVRLHQVVFAAPDVDRNRFESLAKSIIGFSQGMTLYAHGNDSALKLSKQLWGGVRAGDIPPEGPVLIAGLDTIDVTSIKTDIFDLNHSGYAQSTELLNDIELLLQTGERPPGKRIPILKRIKTPKGDYWRYPG